MDYENQFVSLLPVIERVIALVCRRHHLRETEIEEFGSDVKIHLIEHDYAVLRRFQHRCSMHTYLIVVVQRLFLNYRNRLWGRWRPSAEAIRRGPVAILMERLIARDGWPLDEALEQMRTNCHVREDRDALRDLAARLSLGPSMRRFVPEDLAIEIPANDAGPEANIVRAEREFVDRRVRVALDEARRSLTAEERLLLKMRFDDGFTVAQIATALHLKQKPLYRTFERLFASLRERLIADGISRDDARAFFDESLGNGGSDGAAHTAVASAPSALVRFNHDRKREGTRG